MGIKDIEGKLEEINIILENYAKNSSFTFLDEMNLGNLTETDLEELSGNQGIYYFEIKKEISCEFNLWIDDFKQRWSNTPVKNSPKLIEKRLKNANHSEWVPLYIGKSKNIKKRVWEHFSLGPNSSTYGMKLLSRDNIGSEIIRVGFITIDTSHYDLVMSKIESVLRNDYKPIIGKQ